MRTRRMLELLPSGSEINFYHDPEEGMWFGRLQVIDHPIVGTRSYSHGTPNACHVPRLLADLLELYCRDLMKQGKEAGHDERRATAFVSTTPERT